MVYIFRWKTKNKCKQIPKIKVHDHIIRALNTPVAIAIAIFKATLVVLFFMHVRYNTPLMWVFAGAGFFWLLILLALTMQDYVTRHWDDEGIPFLIQ